MPSDSSEDSSSELESLGDLHEVIGVVELFDDGVARGDEAWRVDSWGSSRS